MWVHSTTRRRRRTVLWSSCHDWAGMWSAKLHQGAVQNVYVVEEVNSCHASESSASSLDTTSRNCRALKPSSRPTNVTIKDLLIIIPTAQSTNRDLNLSMGDLIKN
jgi:hypothetical protein